MIKRLIFDLDDTLIKWDSKVFKPMFETLKEENIKVDNVEEKMEKFVKAYESKYKKYDKKKLEHFLEQHFEIELDQKIVNTWLSKIESNNKVNEEVINTLEYLSKKYSMVVLTNFFTNTQKTRLKKAGILKYFDYVLGADRVDRKPYIKGYQKACKGYKKYQCMMIGDSDTDIKGADNFGISSVKLEVENIERLKDIL